MNIGLTKLTELFIPVDAPPTPYPVSAIIFFPVKEFINDHVTPFGTICTEDG